MEEGWIKLHRSIKAWQHYKEPMVMLVWVDLLLSANAKGELVTSVSRLMESTGIGSHHTIVTALRVLEESGEITRRRDGNATVVTIANYKRFQGRALNAILTPQGTALNAIPDPQGMALNAIPDPQGMALNAVPNIQEYLYKNINTPNGDAPAPAREGGKVEKIGLEAFGVMKNVMLAAGQRRALVERFGADEVASATDDLSCKLADGTTESLNHYATLTRWLSYRARKGWSRGGGGTGAGHPPSGRDLIGTDFVSD